MAVQQPITVSGPNVNQNLPMINVQSFIVPSQTNVPEEQPSISLPQSQLPQPSHFPQSHLPQSQHIILPQNQTINTLPIQGGPPFMNYMSTENTQPTVIVLPEGYLILNKPSYAPIHQPYILNPESPTNYVNMQHSHQPLHPAQVLPHMMPSLYQRNQLVTVPFNSEMIQPQIVASQSVCQNSNQGIKDASLSTTIETAKTDKIHCTPAEKLSAPKEFDPNFVEKMMTDESPNFPEVKNQLNEYRSIGVNTELTPHEFINHQNDMEAKPIAHAGPAATRSIDNNLTEDAEQHERTDEYVELSELKYFGCPNGPHLPSSRGSINKTPAHPHGINMLRDSFKRSGIFDIIMAKLKQNTPVEMEALNKNRAADHGQQKRSSASVNSSATNHELDLINAITEEMSNESQADKGEMVLNDSKDDFVTNESRQGNDLHSNYLFFRPEPRNADCQKDMAGCCEPFEMLLLTQHCEVQIERISSASLSCLPLKVRQENFDVLDCRVGNFSDHPQNNHSLTSHFFTSDLFDQTFIDNFSPNVSQNPLELFSDCPELNVDSENTMPMPRCTLSRPGYKDSGEVKTFSHADSQDIDLVYRLPVNPPPCVAINSSDRNNSNLNIGIKKSAVTDNFYEINMDEEADHIFEDCDDINFSCSDDVVRGHIKREICINEEDAPCCEIDPFADDGDLTQCDHSTETVLLKAKDSHNGKDQQTFADYCDRLSNSEQSGSSETRESVSINLQTLNKTLAQKLETLKMLRSESISHLLL